MPMTEEIDHFLPEILADRGRSSYPPFAAGADHGELEADPHTLLRLRAATSYAGPWRRWR